MKIWYKFLNWYYSTALGGQHLEFLLWLDRRTSKPKYLTPKEVQQIVRQYSLLDNGVKEVKNKINNLVKARTKEEYRATLSDIENLIDLAQKDTNSAEGQFANFLQQTVVRKGGQDITSATDRAKMIETKIQAVYELRDHIVMRNKLREIRKLRTEGKNEEADKLFQEWNKIYGNLKR